MTAALLSRIHSAWSWPSVCVALRPPHVPTPSTTIVKLLPLKQWPAAQVSKQTLPEVMLHVAPTTWQWSGSHFASEVMHEPHLQGEVPGMALSS